MHPSIQGNLDGQLQGIGLEPTRFEDRLHRHAEFHDRCQLAMGGLPVVIHQGCQIGHHIQLVRSLVDTPGGFVVLHRLRYGAAGEAHHRHQHDPPVAAEPLSHPWHPAGMDTQAGETEMAGGVAGQAQLFSTCQWIQQGVIQQLGQIRIGAFPVGGHRRRLLGWHQSRSRSGGAKGPWTLASPWQSGACLTLSLIPCGGRIPSPLTARLIQLGLTPYEDALALQQALQASLLADADAPEALLLLEHPACYTLGSGSDPGFLTFNPAAAPAPLYRTTRGGEVTHHCPGQLVGYPVLDLRRHRTDLHWYLRTLEQVLIDVLAVFGLQGGRIEGLTGVWLEGCKVAAIGVGARRWVTQHGFALNVNCNLAGFEAIVPCGISDRPVAKLSDWCSGLTVAAVQPWVERSMAAHFCLDFTPYQALRGSSQVAAQAVGLPGLQRDQRPSETASGSCAGLACQ